MKIEEALASSLIELQSLSLRLSLVKKFVRESKEEMPNIISVVEKNLIIEKKTISQIETNIKDLVASLEKRITDTMGLQPFTLYKADLMKAYKAIEKLNSINEDCVKVKNLKKLDCSKNPTAMVEQFARDLFNSLDRTSSTVKLTPQITEELRDKIAKKSFVEDVKPEQSSLNNIPEVKELPRCCEEVVDKVKSTVITACIPGVLIEPDFFNDQLATLYKKEVVQYIAEQK